jgi:hypothetical protein
VDRPSPGRSDDYLVLHLSEVLRLTFPTSANCGSSLSSLSPILLAGGLFRYAAQDGSVHLVADQIA